MHRNGYDATCWTLLQQVLLKAGYSNFLFIINLLSTYIVIYCLKSMIEIEYDDSY